MFTTYRKFSWPPGHLGLLSYTTVDPWHASGGAAVTLSCDYYFTWLPPPPGFLDDRGKDCVLALYSSPLVLCLVQGGYWFGLNSSVWMLLKVKMMLLHTFVWWLHLPSKSGITFVWLEALRVSTQIDSWTWVGKKDGQYESLSVMWLWTLR